MKRWHYEPARYKMESIYKVIMRGQISLELALEEKNERSMSGPSLLIESTDFMMIISQT